MLAASAANRAGVKGRASGTTCDSRPAFPHNACACTKVAVRLLDEAKHSASCKSSFLNFVGIVMVQVPGEVQRNDTPIQS